MSRHDKTKLVKYLAGPEEPVAHAFFVAVLAGLPSCAAGFPEGEYIPFGNRARSIGPECVFLGRRTVSRCPAYNISYLGAESTTHVTLEHAPSSMHAYHSSAGFFHVQSVLVARDLHCVVALAIAFSKLQGRNR